MNLYIDSLYLVILCYILNCNIVLGENYLYDNINKYPKILKLKKIKHIEEILDIVKNNNYIKFKENISQWDDTFNLCPPLKIKILELIFPIDILNY